MFGFSKKEKLIKLIMDCSEANIDQYKADAREWMEKSRRGIYNEQERELLYREIRESYCLTVEEDVVAAISDEDETITEKIEKIIMDPPICGYNINLKEGSFMAGRVYAICYYAIKGQKADPDDCVELNNKQNDLMNRAMGEITEEYLRNISEEYIAYDHLDEIAKEGVGASPEFLKMVMDMKTMAESFKKKAENDVISQCDMGLCYYYGFGFPKDAGVAYDWFKKSAEGGNKVAATFMKYIEDERELANIHDADKQFELGWSYYTGEGYERDYDKAFSYFRRAALMNQVNAQFNLALMYYKGESVKPDIEKALSWYEKAANQGSVNAAYNLGTIYLLGKGIDKDYAKAREWLMYAAERGNIDAEYNIGLMYDRGDGVEQNYEEAARWYEKASSQGYAKAQYNLGLMFHEGRGVPKDEESALKLYKLAAEQGYVHAWFALGLIYDEGVIVPHDSAKAISWYEKAAEAKDPRALYNLAVIYDIGDGVDVDLNKAKELYLASSKLGYLKAVEVVRKLGITSMLNIGNEQGEARARAEVKEKDSEEIKADEESIEIKTDEESVKIITDEKIDKEGKFKNSNNNEKNNLNNNENNNKNNNEINFGEKIETQPEFEEMEEIQSEDKAEIKLGNDEEDE